MLVDETSLVLSSELSLIPKLEPWIKEHLFSYITKVEEQTTLHLILQEALVNAIVHGNKEDKNKKVTLTYSYEKPLLHIFIFDEGEGIPQKSKEKSEENIKTEDLLLESGRGIILMKHFCKEVIFHKNCVELIVEVL